MQALQKNWESKQIGDIFKVTRGHVLAATKVLPIQDDINIYPVCSSQTKNDGLLGYYEKYLFENTITWTTDDAYAGTIRFREEKFYSTNVNGVLLSKKGFSTNAFKKL